MPRLFAVTLLVVLSACATDTPAPDPAEPSTSVTTSPTGEPGSTPSTTPEPTAPEPALLDWQPVSGPLSDEVTVSGPWTLALPEGGATVRLTGPEPQHFDAARGYRFTDALIDGDYVVVVAEHQLAARPSVVSVVELATGDTLEGDVPTGVGGDVALGSGLLALTLPQGADYCLTVHDLSADRSRRGPCVPPRHGISTLTISPAGVAAMTFDDGRPSCRTLNRVEGTSFEPLPGVEDCRGWEAVVTETAALWGVVDNERRVEASTLYADAGDGPVEVGPVTTGTLTWCGDAAYVVRDPQRDRDPARLLRVETDGSVEVVYESPGAGRAFLSAPRCGGTDLTVTAYTDDGDEQVTARLD